MTILFILLLVAPATLCVVLLAIKVGALAHNLEQLEFRVSTLEADLWLLKRRVSEPHPEPALRDPPPEDPADYWKHSED